MLSNVEILAWLIIVGTFVKLSVFLIKGPKNWINVVKFVMSGSSTIKLMYVVLLAGTGWMLFQEVTVLEFLASVLVMSVFLGLAFTFYGKECIPAAKAFLSQKPEKIREKIWLTSVIWMVVVFWGLAVLMGWL